MSTILRMNRPRCLSRDRFVAAIFALVVPSIARGQVSTCLPVVDTAAPGGSIPLKVLVADPLDPTPIIIDLQGSGLPAGLGAVQGVTLPGFPDAAGTVVAVGTSLVIQTVAPSAMLGPAFAPMIAMNVAAPTTTVVRITAIQTLDPAASALDPFGNPKACVLDPLPVTSVANGAASINDVLPGGGLLLAGSLVAVVGIGFQPGALASIDGVALASTSRVDSTRIEVVTAVDAQLDGKTVSIRNPDGTGATYLSYLRATELGKSARPLLAATQAIFPVRGRSSGLFAAPASGTFFGLALQNPDPADAIVSVELWNAGAVVASASLALPSRTRISREVSELLPGLIPGAGSSFKVTATVPVQMLGLSGNETNGSVKPVLPAVASP